MTARQSGPAAVSLTAAAAAATTTLPIPKKSRTIKTDKPRPFLCPICTRTEHLKRHQRSHTREKPFVCVFCGRCFARRDLVLRYQTKLHSSIMNNSATHNDNILASTAQSNSNLKSLANTRRKSSVGNLISQLFTTRQLDLLKEESLQIVLPSRNNEQVFEEDDYEEDEDDEDGEIYITPSRILNPLSLMQGNQNENLFTQKLQSASTTSFKELNFFNEELRSTIIMENDLKQDSLPTVAELNNYLKMYENEFHKYFPFIHLETIEPSIKNAPLLLSIAMIGALYAFHSSHSKFLSIIATIYVKRLLDTTKEDNIPLWVIQSTILLTFMGIFSDDINVIKNMDSQLITLNKLILRNKINLPLETQMQPPINNHQFRRTPPSLGKTATRTPTPPNVITSNPNHPHEFSTIEGGSSDENILGHDTLELEQNEKYFQYFILAQSRIRTCHVVLLLSNLFASMVGIDCSFHSIDLRCGTPCQIETLFHCSTASEWMNQLSYNNIVLDSKFSLITLSNGDSAYEECLMYLSNGNQFFYENNKISLLTALSLMVTIHEKIFIERKAQEQRNFNSADIQMNDLTWKMTSRPIIDSMIKYWETVYMKNGGILLPTEQTIPIIKNQPTIRLTIPLYLFVKIRRCLDLTHVMNRIWLKDWNKMNTILDEVCYDWDSLQEATEYSLSMINSWVSVLCVTRVNGSSTNFRTPVFTTMCVFVTILVIAEYLKRIELWASQYDPMDQMPTTLRISDRILWLKTESVLKRVQKKLLPQGDLMKSYVEFLRLQNDTNGSFDIKPLSDELVQRCMGPEAPLQDTVHLINKAKLSSRCLYLGVRILGDAPIWPIALSFAHALQSRAIYNVLNRRSSNASINTDTPDVLSRMGSSHLQHEVTFI